MPTEIEMTESAEQDQSAVAAVRRGDAERYRELVERHERRVYAVAWSRLGDAALAEEAAQEAFIRAYRRLWLLGDGAKFAGWIATITRRIAINLGLRHRRELDKCQRWALENLPATTREAAAAPDEPLYTPETLRQTLAELPPAHRECLVLFYLEGKSGAEAAAALGISEAALRVRLHRARAVLRERLEEKLAGSLAGLRPAKTLVPAIMAGVLATSAAKAATVGATVAGALAKTGLAKILLPLGTLFSTFFMLPGVLAGWLGMRMELRNFRDQSGFRARLLRNTMKGRIFYLVGMVVVVGVVLPALVRLAPWRSLGMNGTDFGSVVIALVLLLQLLSSVRQLVINRNPFHLGTTAMALLMSLGLLLMGLHAVPVSSFPFFTACPVLLIVGLRKYRPARMDYNLFIRAAEKLLCLPAAKPPRGRFTKADLMSFARFLGTRWLVNGYRWRADGLWLYLPVCTHWDTLFSRLFRRRSRIRLGWDGTVLAEMSRDDLHRLARLGHSSDFPPGELEAMVASAVDAAWAEVRQGDTTAAERALGQEPESDVFIAPPSIGGSSRLRWLSMFLIGISLMLLVSLHFPGCRERLAGLKPVSLSEARVRAFLNDPSPNPNTNQWQAVNSLDLASYACIVLPPTNLYTPERLSAARNEIFAGANFNPASAKNQRLAAFTYGVFLEKAMVAGWIDWSFTGLTPADATTYFHQLPKRRWKFALSREHAWSWVDNQGWEVERINDFTLNELRWLKSVNCLDLVDCEKLIRQITSVQTLSRTPPGQPPIHDWKSVRGLFFTPGWPVLQDTYFSLAALEALGALDRIDREQCIRGILRLHLGKGFFSSPESGSYNEYHVDGSARDTLAAFEALRILGALDQVKDLDQWQFRPLRHDVAAGDLTWNDVEAWTCQQRLAKILAEHKAQPQSPFRSLLQQ